MKNSYHVKLMIAMLCFVSISAHAQNDDSDDHFHATSSGYSQQASKRFRTSIQTPKYDNAEPVATARPNAVTIEGGGRGLLWSLNYDRSLGQNFGLGVGYSLMSLTSAPFDITMTVIPLYGNYYFSPNTNRGFVTLGVDIATAKIAVHPYSYSYTTSGTDMETETTHISSFGNTEWASGTVAIPTFGGGYELRTTGGFVLRLAAYGLIIPGQVLPWAGISLGGAF